MRVIDFHTHCFPDDIAQKAVARIAQAYGIVPAFDGTIQGLIAQMDAAGIEASVIMPVATKASQVTGINDWAVSVRSERIIPFGAMHPDFPTPHSEIDRILSLGMVGIKLHPNWQGFRPDDSSMFRIYEAAEGRLIVCFHMGDEIQSPPEVLGIPESLVRVHRAFPNMIIIAAHMGGFMMWEQAREHLVGRDVYFDISVCLPEYLSDDELVCMIRTHGVEKVLFASDSPCAPPALQLQRLLSLPLTDDEKEKICWRNACRLIGGSLSSA